MVSMKVTPPFLEIWLSEPQYYHFDAPWDELPSITDSSSPSTLSVYGLKTDLI